MNLTFSIGYANFTVLLMLLTGVFILWIDVKGYNRTGMKREQRTARFLGWFNIIAGLGTFIVNLFYQSMQL
ncbi:CLC_0170 family protein [Paenibacillus radicis (ex Xue et al. 2023)]|uniref:Uncharacterized protein n=1 Tax=Paenibacillus radicis (ex Xue et al. 2023) TaxID=2972489 RepID=A0ABT1YNJ0_9BACL|nr:CLC_0170 family protein [Paenibacillus radicis (ex Xue et al. 2023)]MCR8634741.1 hypothetical protein [Paenibacillus radicis (ex Xue et al. 2023)]